MQSWQLHPTPPPQKKKKKKKNSQLNRVNSSDTEAPFFYLNLCISNGTASTKIYDKWTIFFDIVNFPFLDGDTRSVPHMGYTYLNLLDSPELLQIFVTLTAEIKPLLPNVLGRAIVILNFVRRFRILWQTQCLGRKI